MFRLTVCSMLTGITEGTNYEIRRQIHRLTHCGSKTTQAWWAGDLARLKFSLATWTLAKKKKKSLGHICNNVKICVALDWKSNKRSFFLFFRHSPGTFNTIKCGFHIALKNCLKKVVLWYQKSINTFDNLLLRYISIRVATMCWLIHWLIRWSKEKLLPIILISKYSFNLYFKQRKVKQMP